MGYMVINFTDPEGALTYALCAGVMYDAEHKDTPYKFLNVQLYTEACGPATPTYEGPFAAVNLQKYGR